MDDRGKQTKLPVWRILLLIRRQLSSRDEIIWFYHFVAAMLLEVKVQKGRTCMCIFKIIMDKESLNKRMLSTTCWFFFLVKFRPWRPRFAPKSLIRVYKRWQGWLWRGSGVWAIKWQLLSGFRVEPHARAPCPGLWLTFPYSHLWNVYFQDKDTMGSYDKYIEFN